MDQISVGLTHKIAGNNTTTIIAVNRGTLQVSGNNCNITVLKNFGTILYSGHQGCINIGGSNQCEEQFEGLIIATCTNLQLVIHDNCNVQMLRFVGTKSVLHTAQTAHVLNGCVNLRVKDRRVRTAHRLRPTAVPTPADLMLVSARCGLMVSNCHGLSIHVQTPTKMPGMSCRQCS